MTARHPLFDYFQRLSQILGVLTRQLGLLAVRHWKKQPLQGPELLREGFEKVGGSFLKLGQILSLQVDTLPIEYCDALLGLLDRVPTASREQVIDVFRREFAKLPEELYDRFDYEAIASASIGQVHKAVLKDGRQVAVKVQRPGVHYDFHRDVLLMRCFIWFVFAFHIRSMYFMRDPVRELFTWTRDELDYRREAAYCEMLGRNAVGSTTERIPRIYWDLTCSRVLTMEFLHGPTVSTYLKMVDRGDERELEKLRAEGFEPAVFSANIISNFLRDAFQFGAFHADLHPANLLILSNNVVGYVDFGIVATLTREARRKQIELTLAYSTGSPEEIYKEFLNICTPTASADLEGMRRELTAMTRNWYEEPAIGGEVRFRISVTAAMLDMLSVARNYGVLVDREMIKYIRGTFLADGLIARLSPGFDIARSLREVVGEYLYDEASRKIFSRAGALSMLTDMTIWMKTGPSAMLRALDLFERRELRARAAAPAPADRNDGLRAKAMAVAAVWACSILFLTLAGGPSWKTAPVFAAVTAIFLGLWTVWMLLLLRRLTAR
ncbi:MAG TPA: AarF/UbiB family protein [Bryobacteraceae bacterium]|nr:AarF/UbiB family protein [Bryobacteraceae bacterium]